MKSRILIILAIVMVFMLACNLLPGDTVDLGTNSSGHSGSNSSGQPTDASGGSTGEGNPGPKTLSVDDPALNAEFTANVDQHNYWIIEGLDTSGSPHTIAQEITQQVQSEPGWAQYYYRGVLRNGETFDFSEFAIHNGQYFSVNDQYTCQTREDQTKDEPAVQPSVYLQELQGTLKRVETGVMVNGILTDRYEIAKKNINTSSVVEVLSGSLYRAQDGGYLVKFEFSAMYQIWAGSAYEKEFDASKQEKWTYLFEQTHYQPGALQVRMPDACAGQGGSGSSGAAGSSGSTGSSAFEGVPADIPMPAESEVTNIFVVTDMISYNTTQDLAAIAEFYRSNMPGLGWTLATDRPSDTAVYFDFTKGDRDVQMNLTAGEGSNQTLVVMYIK